jgi:hypothetical protein
VAIEQDSVVPSSFMALVTQVLLVTSNIIISFKSFLRSGRVAQVVEPSKHEVLSSILNTPEKKKEKKHRWPPEDGKSKESDSPSPQVSQRNTILTTPQFKDIF